VNTAGVRRRDDLALRLPAGVVAPGRG
jgi:hypothetical protein